MDSSKIRWIYAGLGLAAGVGLVISASSSAKQEAKPSPVPIPPSPPPPEPPSPSIPAPPSTKTADRILLIGDSLAYGLAFPLKQLASKSNVPFAADGRVGTTIHQWASSTWLPNALVFKPTLTLISLGTNDMKLLNPLAEEKDLSGLVQKILGAKSRVVFIAPPTMPFPDKGVRAMIESQKQPIFRSDQLQIPRAPDQIHPTAAGYAGWAGAIWSWLYQPALGNLPNRKLIRRQPMRTPRLP